MAEANQPEQRPPVDEVEFHYSDDDDRAQDIHQSHKENGYRTFMAPFVKQAKKIRRRRASR